MATKGISGTAIAVVFGGTILAYSGIKGVTITKTIGSLLAGNSPASATAANAFSVGGAVSDKKSASFVGSAAAPPESNSGGEAAFISYCANTLGFSKAGTAGAAGNAQEESGFSTTSLNGREGAIGYCQWEDGRRSALQAYAKLHGLTETDSAAQLGYMRAELMSGYAPVMVYMKAAKDPASAAAFWDAHYEVSAGTTRQERINNAEAIYATL